MSKVITIFNKKGGVGKSTLATNLAVEYSRLIGETILVDIDISRTSFKFMQRRADLELDNDTLKVAIPENLDELDVLLEESDIYRIIDVGGFSDEMSIASIMGSDLLVVPVSDSPQDRDTTEEFITTLLKLKQDGFLKDAIFVLNNTNPRTKFSNLTDSVKYIRDAGFDLYGAISTYTIFKLAHGGGQSVVEINDSCKASSTILKLISGIQGRFDG